MLVFSAGGGEEKQAIKSGEKRGEKHDRSKSESRARVVYSIKKSGQEKDKIYEMIWHYIISYKR